MYFWSLIVAVLIFGLGGGVSFYEGFQHIQQPEPIRDPTWNYVVLAAAALFEGTSFGIALNQFKKEVGARPFWRALHASKDPTTYTVLAEDSAALLGLAIAAAGIYLSHRLEMPELDGVASLVIGLLLAGVAVLLIRESRGLLIGEGVRPETARAIRATARVSSPASTRWDGSSRCTWGPRRCSRSSTWTSRTEPRPRTRPPRSQRSRHAYGHAIR